MLDPNAGAAGADPNAGGTGGGADAPPELTSQEMLAGISEQLGGAPSGREDAPEMTDVEKTLMDNQFQQETRNQLEDMQKQVKSLAPDATENQAFSFGIAMMKGDVSGAFEAVKNIVKTEAEVDEKNEEQKPLTVEGGSQGKGDDNREPTGLAGVFAGIQNKYGSGASS